MIPYSGKQGHLLLSKKKKQFKRILPEDIKTMITYESTKLSSKFPVVDKTDLFYYIGETNRRIAERIKDHNIRDKNSHLFKHAREKGHTHVWESDFKILGNNNQSHFKRKISESLFMRQGLSKFHARFPCKTCAGEENNYFTAIWVMDLKQMLPVHY